MHQYSDKNNSHMNKYISVEITIEIFEAFILCRLTHIYVIIIFIIINIKKLIKFLIFQDRTKFNEWLPLSDA